MAPTRRLAAAALASLALAWAPAEAQAPAAAPRRQVADLLITGGTVVTMDRDRRVIPDGAVAVVKDRIVAVGTTREVTARYTGRTTLDARRQVVMPGLVDGHGHAGHTLLKTLGMDVDGFYGATEAIYARGSTVGFWRADGALAALEKLRAGVTTSLVLFGGGDNVWRTDQVRYGVAYLEAVRDVGLRWTLAVGPRRPPFPTPYAQWDSGRRTDTPVSFAQQMAVSESLIVKWHGAAGGRLRMAVVYPTINPATAPIPPAAMAELRAQAQEARALSKRRGLLFAQDGHTRGTIQFAHDSLGLLGPDAVFSHATELTPEEIALVARTGTKIVHNPSAIYSMRGRCPVTELIDAGATVMLGSDGTAPDRSYDMFRHIFQAGRYHRFFFRDPDVLPAGKILEMATVDAARALGLQDEIGALEPGKKADVILVDLWQPHLVPMQMPLYRLAYFANGSDVRTVVVDGRILMRDRRVLTVDQDRILAAAQREADDAVRRTGLEQLLETPEGFWGRTHLPKRP